MTQDIRDFVTGDLLALGEPTHQEPAFARVRNALFEQLAGHGFRSFALETDRVAALAVNDFVQEGVGTLDSAMKEGFSHGFGDLDGNRQLVAWMREYNESRPAHERLAFHGIDAPLETYSAPSPRRCLEHARDYLGLDVDLADLVGDDERWSRTESVMDPAMSPGATAEADRLRVLADDMLTALYAQAPVLIAATSRAEWLRAGTYLTAGIGLLRYHRQCAQPMERDARIARLFNLRDVLMAQNLLAIRDVEAQRGATLVCAHNTHLRRTWGDNGDLTWFGAGAIIGSLLGERFTVVVGSLGRSPAIGLGEPDPNTYEGHLQRGIATWGLVPATEVAPGDTRTDTKPQQGYFPLDRTTLDGADAVLHLNSGD